MSLIEPDLLIAPVFLAAILPYMGTLVKVLRCVHCHHIHSQTPETYKPKTRHEFRKKDPNNEYSPSEKYV
jgi:hypothetical protein